jgi:hypothetical protein
MRVVENALNTTFFDHILTLKAQNDTLDHNPKVLSLSEKRSIIDIKNRYFPNNFQKRPNHVILTSDSENSAKNTLNG